MRRATRTFALVLVVIVWSQTAAAQEMPRGWSTQQTAEGVRIHTPPDLKPGEVYSVAFYAEQPLDGKPIEEWLRSAIPQEPAAPGTLLTHGVDAKNVNIAIGVAGFTTPEGAKRYALYTAFSPDQLSVYVVRIMTDPKAPLFNRYKAQTDDITRALIADAGRKTNAPALAAAEEPTAATGARAKTAARRGAASVSTGPLPAASIGGAQIFIRYTATHDGFNFITYFDHLLLFPDGTAFDDIPSEPITSFDPATIRGSIKPWKVGRWEKQGATIVLSFPDNEQRPRRVLRKHPKGWTEETGKTEGSYDVYFPVLPIPKQLIGGAWSNKNLTTMGFPGGMTPMVASGSTGDFLFNADGTYSNTRESFAGATGETVVSAHTRSQSAIGRWRLDDLLLTLEKDGERTVQVAFVMPNWSSDPIPDLMIGGNRWERPNDK